MQIVERKFSDVEKDFITRKTLEYGLDNPKVLNYPEFNEVLIASCMNAEKNGELDLFLDTVSFIKENFGPYSGKISISSLTFNRLFEAKKYSVDLEKTYKDAGSPQNLDSNDNLFQYLLVEKTLKAKDADCLLSGRFKLANNFFIDDDLVSEGLLEARSILSEIENYYLHVKDTEQHITPLHHMFQRANIMMNVKEMLSDMNIRGRQLIDACEFAGNDPQNLAMILDDKNTGIEHIKNLIKYINQKAAKRIESGLSEEEPIAVLSGTSDDYLPASKIKTLANNKYIMNKLNYNDYLITDVKTIDTDYKNLDIISGTNMATAIKIAESRGFHVIKNVPISDKFDASNPAHSIIMYNDKTGAIISAPIAHDNCFCYGGCDLSFTLSASYDISMLHCLLHCSSHYIGEINDLPIREYQATYHEGLFANYEKIEDKVVKLDDNAIIANIHKCNYICPIPTYVNPEYIRQDEQNKILQSYNVCIDEYVVDKISSCINLLMAKNDPELINSDNKIYGHFFNSDAFYKDLARETSIYFSSSDISFQILDIALSYLKVPDKDKMEIAHGLQNWLVKESNHLCLSQDKKECLGKSLDQYMNSDKIMDQTQVEELMENLNYPKVEDLPITLPWINKDKDYEYQEERIKREDVVME